MINDVEFLEHTGSIDQILMNEADGFPGLENDDIEMDNEGIVEGIRAAFGGMGI